MALISPTSYETHTEIDVKDISSPLSGENVSSSGMSDEDGLRLVIQDQDLANAFLTKNYYPQRWLEIDTLYQSPRFYSTQEGTQAAEANYTSHTIAKHINAIVPQCTSGLFYMKPPFHIRPHPGTTEEVVRAKMALFSAQLDDMEFPTQVEDGIFYTALFGTAIYKWEWRTKTKKVSKYVRKAEPLKIDNSIGAPLTVHTEESDTFERIVEERDDSRPHFEHIDLRYVLVDPGCRVADIRKAKWVAHVTYMTFNQLNDLRGVEGWNIPDEETLKSYFDRPEEAPRLPGVGETNMVNYALVPHAQPRYQEDSADPTQRGLKVVERWDKDRVITVLQDKLVIRNEANPYGKIPFYSSHWWKIPNSFYGMGIGSLLIAAQRAEQGMQNAALNLLSMMVNPTYLRAKGANVPTQMIKQRRGGIIDVDGEVDKAFRLLEQPRVPQELFAILQYNQGESEQVSAADSLLVQGSTQGPRSSMGRTAGGAATLAAGSATRLQAPMTRFINNVFEPWIWQMDELNNDLLPLSTLRAVLGEELEDGFSVDHGKFVNATLNFEVLAGAHLAAKRAMAQVLPMFESIVENPSFLAQLNATGWTFDVKEWIDCLLEVSEWRNTRNFVRKLNPDEKQHMQANNPNAGKLKQAMALNDQKAKNQAALQDQKNDQRATDLVMRKMLEAPMLQEALEGQSGGKGFGDYEE